MKSKVVRSNRVFFRVIVCAFACALIFTLFALPASAALDNSLGKTYIASPFDQSSLEDLASMVLAQYSLSSSLTVNRYGSNSTYYYSPFMITMFTNVTLGVQSFGYRVYFTKADFSPDLLEDVFEPGYSFATFSSYTSFSINLELNGGITKIDSYSSSTSFTLSSNEQVVYLFRGSIVSGPSTLPSAYGGSSSSSYPIIQHWKNALTACNGDVVQSDYDAGYDAGFAVAGSSTGEAYQNGYLAGETAGYQNGYTTGRDNGYQLGLADGKAMTPPIYSLDIPMIITSIPAAIQTFLGSFTTIEIFGINIGGLLRTLILIAAISFVFAVLYGLWKGRSDG